MRAEGRYPGRAVEWGLTEAKTGTVQMAVLFDFLDPSTLQPNGDRMTWYAPITSEALDTSIGGLRACGWTGSDLSEDVVGLKDHVVDLVIKHATYEGKTSPRIAWVNFRGLQLANPLSREKAVALAAKTKHLIAGIK